MMNLVWLQNAAAIVRARKKILTMAIKKQLQNMVFLSNKNHLQSFYFGIFFLASHCYRSVEPIYKNSKDIFRLQCVRHQREMR